MKFLKKLFNRSGGEDEDDLDDEEEFGFDEDPEDEDDQPRTQVIMDDDDVLDDPSAGDEHFGMGSDLSGDDDDDGPPVTMGGDTYNVEVDDSEDAAEMDVDFDDDDEIDFGDDDEDDEYDDASSGGSRKKLVFAAVGVGVLLLGIVGGSAFWFFGSDAQEQAVVESEELEGGVQMALPPRSGSLNALGAGEDETPTENSEDAQSAADAEAPEQTADETKSGESEEALPSATESQMTSSATLGSSSLNALAGSGAAGQGIIIPSVTSASFREVRDQPKPTPLANAPDRRLLERVDGLKGPLPSVSKDGRRLPWEVYARPLTGNEKGQRVGVLVTGLGLSRAATMAAINKLPGEFSLVFEPYAPDLDDWLLRARLAGHEVFVGLPMESEDFPAEDPGPLGLTTTVQVTENMHRLHGVLSSFAGYVGVVSLMGSKFSKAEGQLKPILAELKKRGLMFVDGGAVVRSVAPRIAAEIDLPRAKSNLTLDEPPSPGNISRKLRQLEKLIKDNATAVATIRAYPSSIDKLAEWAGTLGEKQLALVPVSAIANKQFIE